MINIFGGIVRCDRVANGVVEAVNDLGLTVPVVVRLEGTNVELGKEILSNSDLDIIPADNLDDAANKIVDEVKGRLNSICHDSNTSYTTTGYNRIVIHSFFYHPNCN